MNSKFIEACIIILITLLIQLFIGKYLWNNAARPLIPMLGKCDNVLQILGLSILVKSIIPTVG